MRSVVSLSNDITVLSDGVKDAQRRNFGVAKCLVIRDVAVNIHQIKSSILVERLRSHAIDFFLSNHLAREPSRSAEYHGDFGRISYLHANSNDTFVEREFQINVWYVDERAGDLMSQTGGERLAVIVETGFWVHLGKGHWFVKTLYAPIQYFSSSLSTLYHV
jgi:hypothetical protein